jgi:hypothetical protein
MTVTEILELDAQPIRNWTGRGRAPRDLRRTATHIVDSPLDQFLSAFDRLDADACAALFADHGCRLGVGLR